MKIEKFERKDGSEGQNYILEEGDQVISRFDTPKTTMVGQFENNSLGVTWEGKEIFLKLTGGQAKALKNIGQLTGKTIKGTKYTNDFGTFVGVKVE